jgi:integrase
MKAFPKQARRTLAVWARVFAFAEHKQWRRGDNPAVWKNNMAFAFHGASNLTSKNYAAMPYEQVRAFIQRLRQMRCASAAALECVILCASRTAEIRCLEWKDINWEQRTLTIPAQRMKARAEHIIPLSDRVRELLQQQKQYSTSQQYVFTGRNAGQPLDEKTMRKVLHHMGESVTVHGFRTSFRTWAAEQTNFDFYAVEMCLAHSVGSAVTRAYLRGNALEKRREIMTAWSEYCGSAAGGTRVGAPHSDAPAASPRPAA